MTILVLMSVILLAGCNPAAVIETQQQDQLVQNVLENIERDDYDEIRGFFIEEVSEDEYYTAMQQIDDYIQGDFVDMEKIGVYFSTHTSNNGTVDTQDLTYRVNTTEDQYTVTMQLYRKNDDEFRIGLFNVILTSELAGNGAIIDFNDIDITQLLLLIFSVLCIGFMIFAVVLCAKSKIRLKGLWIVLILLIQTGISISSFPNQSSFTLMFFSTNISSLRKFINGGTILTVLVPVGAILFVVLRKHLVVKAKMYNERKAIEILQNDTQSESQSREDIPLQ